MAAFGFPPFAEKKVNLNFEPAEIYAAAKKALADAKTDEEKEAAKKRVQKASMFPSAKMMGPADGPGATFAPKFYDFALVNTLVSAHYVDMLAPNIRTVLWVHEAETVLWGSPATAAKWR